MERNAGLSFGLENPDKLIAELTQTLA